MTGSDTTTDLDENLQVLASHYRRWVLYVLMNRDVGALNELVPLISILKEAATDERIDETKLTIQLQQIHLPKLADVGLLEYDPRSGVIALGDLSEELREQLAIIETWEDPAVRAEIP